MHAVVAVMRQLLQPICGMLEHDQNFDGNNVFKIASDPRPAGAAQLCFLSGPVRNMSTSVS